MDTKFSIGTVFFLRNQSNSFVVFVEFPNLIYVIISNLSFLEKYQQKKYKLF